MAARRSHSRALSALFDIELDDSCLVQDKHDACLVAAELRGLLTCSSKTKKQLLRDAEQAREIALHGDVLDLPAFAEVLASRGHLICLRTGRPDSKCCPQQVALRHTFVVAGAAGRRNQAISASPGSSPGSSCCTPTATQLFVVDPCFRDHFLLSNATRAYRALCDELPTLFVGTAEQLVPVVELMCTQMQLVFEETASSCPPWRTASCMISKWLPSNADDVPVLPPGSGAAAADSSSNDSAFADAGVFAAGSIIAPGCGSLRRTTSGASTASTSNNQQSSELVYTPRTCRAPYCGRIDSSSNVLLSGSLVGLGDSPSPFGLLAATADADTPATDGQTYHGFTGLNGDISCIVYSGISPDSWTGKPGYLGAVACCSGVSSSGCCTPTPATGLAIKAGPGVPARNTHECFRAEAAAAAAVAVQLQREQLQQDALRRMSDSGVVTVSGLAPLDIRRFNATMDDLDLSWNTRNAKALPPRRQDGRQGPAKRRPGLVSQCSALSAAIAGKVL